MLRLDLILQRQIKKINAFLYILLFFYFKNLLMCFDINLGIDNEIF